MFFEKFKRGVREYKEHTKGMTFKQRISYTWEYYKGALWIIGTVVVIAAIITTSVLNANTEVIISGVTVNTDLAIEGIGAITDDFYKEKSKLGKRQRVDYSGVYLYEEGTKENIEYTYDALQSIVAQVSAKDLDYMLTDEIGFKYCIGHEIYMDLREFFSDEELELYKDKLIYGQLEGSDEQIPIAVNISDSGFVKKYSSVKGKEVYLCFIVNTSRKGRCREFFDYLMSF